MRIWPYPIFIPYNKNGTHTQTTATSGTALAASIFGMIFFGALGLVLSMPPVENAIVEWFVADGSGSVDALMKHLLVIKVISISGFGFCMIGAIIAFMQRCKEF